MFDILMAGATEWADATNWRELGQRLSPPLIYPACSLLLPLFSAGGINK